MLLLCFFVCVCVFRVFFVYVHVSLKFLGGVCVCVSSICLYSICVVSFLSVYVFCVCLLFLSSVVWKPSMRMILHVLCLGGFLTMHLLPPDNSGHTHGVTRLECYKSQRVRHVVNPPYSFATPVCIS